jgi:hypothetical protein
MRLLSTAALASLTLLAACDVGDLDVLGSSPSRPQIDIPKEVTTVSTAEVVGSWTCRELNPYPDMPAVAVAMTFAADGTMAAESTMPMEQAMPGAGDMLMTWTGNWAVEGDRLITSGTEVEKMMADGTDTGLAGMLNQFIARFSDQADDMNAEVLRITAIELVMRDQSPDAATVACMRQA